MQSNVTHLELDLLLLCYVNSNQFGVVDVQTVAEIAKSKLGVILPRSDMVITDKHVEVLVKYGLLPDVNSTFDKIKSNPPKN